MVRLDVFVSPWTLIMARHGLMKTENWEEGALHGIQCALGE
jgi:hypothetical protein